MPLEIITVIIIIAIICIILALDRLKLQSFIWNQGST